MWRRTLWIVLTPLILAGVMILDSGGRVAGLPSEVTELRVGYFATVLHAPAIVGIGEGLFQEALAGVRIVPRLFNAGPTLIEALFAGEIDIAYVGPNPAINAWVRSQWQAIRIVVGSTVGGEAFVVRPDWSPVSPLDYAGRLLGTPQTGNTQDVSLRRYLHDLGVASHGTAEGVKIIAPGNSEVFGMFARGALDGAWLAEPWVTRLIDEASGILWFDASEVYTAYVAVRPQLLDNAPELVEAWLRVHIAVSQRLSNSLPDAAIAVATQLSALWKQHVQPKTVEASLQRVRFTWDVSEDPLVTRADDAFRLGFLGSEAPVVRGIVDRSILDRAVSSLGIVHSVGEMVAK